MTHVSLFTIPGAADTNIHTRSRTLWAGQRGGSDHKQSCSRRGEDSCRTTSHERGERQVMEGSLAVAAPGEARYYIKSLNDKREPGNELW